MVLTLVSSNCDDDFGLILIVRRTGARDKASKVTLRGSLPRVHQVSVADFLYVQRSICHFPLIFLKKRF